MPIFNIVTDFGSTFVEGNKQVYVRNRDVYNKVDSRYLNFGDKILFEKDYISKGLEDVDSVFELRSEAYRNAKSILFERNSNGIYVPKLRTEIIRGIEIPSENLEDKILRNNAQDFSPKEYRAMVDLVHEMIISYARRNNAQAPVWETVLRWVDGQVIAPANKHFFDSLSDVNNYFHEVYTSFQDGGGFHDAYEYFMKVRRGVTAYIAKIRSESELKENASKTWSQERRGNLSEEIDIIMREFGTEIQSQYVDAEIKEIQRVRKKNEERVRARKQNEQHLFKGVYTDTTTPESRQVISIDQIDFSSLVDVNLLKEPDLYIQKLKELCVKNGFPVKMMREYLLREDPKGIEEAKRDANQFFESRNMNYEGLKEEFIRIFEETTGRDYYKLGGAEKAYVDRIILENVVKTARDLSQHIDELSRSLKKLTSKIKEEL